MTKQELEQLGVGKIAELWFDKKWDEWPNFSGGFYSFTIDIKPAKHKQHCVACYERLKKGEFRIRIDPFRARERAKPYCLACIAAYIWLHKDPDKWLEKADVMPKHYEHIENKLLEEINSLQGGKEKPT